MMPSPELAHGGDADRMRPVHAEHRAGRQPRAKIGQCLAVAIGLIRPDQHMVVAGFEPDDRSDRHDDDATLPADRKSLVRPGSMHAIEPLVRLHVGASFAPCARYAFERSLHHFFLVYQPSKAIVHVLPSSDDASHS
jgi:hypothetical protein